MNYHFINRHGILTPSDYAIKLEAIAQYVFPDINWLTNWSNLLGDDRINYRCFTGTYVSALTLKPVLFEGRLNATIHKDHMGNQTLLEGSVSGKNKGAGILEFESAMSISFTSEEGWKYTEKFPTFPNVSHIDLPITITTDLFNHIVVTFN